MNKRRLDLNLIEYSTPEYIEKEFKDYVSTKMRVPIGVDGVTSESFEHQIQRRSKDISERIKNARYFFKPLREVAIKKHGTNQGGSTRNISISSIQDMLVQRILYRVISEHVEQSFKRLPIVSFAYRKGYSAPKAVRTIHRNLKEGYVHVLDADIYQFFDEIPHDILLDTISHMLGENPLCYQYMKRYISSDRVKWESYEGNIKQFHIKKPKRTKREKGIPQGGVLSGLLANMYLHSFDEYVVNELGRQIDLRYVRYADDFVIMVKDKNELSTIFKKVKEKLNILCLTMHPDPIKTNQIDLLKNPLTFVGFELTPQKIRINQSNIERFKGRMMSSILKGSFEESVDIEKLINRMNKKLKGPAPARLSLCLTCGLQKQNHKNWMHFFLSLTDVQQLKTLDRWLRKQIHQHIYNKTGKRVQRGKLKNLIKLENMYYSYRKNIQYKGNLCSCATTKEPLGVFSQY